ncbi:MAG TPA: hypothetical protein VKV02_12285 [Acidobacteriaceae bacterium]|nr:hypothetical protein [Acidobacteriaceae bacterium]
MRSDHVYTNVGRVTHGISRFLHHRCDLYVLPPNSSLSFVDSRIAIGAEGYRSLGGHVPVVVDDDGTT